MDEALAWLASVDPFGPLPEVGLLAGVGAAVIAHGGKSKWLRWVVRGCWAGVAAVPWFVAAWAGAVALGLVWAVRSSILGRRRVAGRGIAVRLLAPPALGAIGWAAARVLTGAVPGAVWAALAGVVVLVVAVAALRRASGAGALPPRAPDRAAPVRGPRPAPPPIPRPPKRGETSQVDAIRKLAQAEFPGLVGARMDAPPEPRTRRERDPVAKWRRKLGGGSIYLGRVGGRPVVLSAEDVSCALFGPSGSGKTTSVLLPSVLAAPGAVVCTSTKDDVARVVAEPRSRLGQVVTIDPTGTLAAEALPPGVSLRRWSPVSASGDPARARRMADVLVDAADGGGDHQSGNARYFAERAATLLGCALHAAAHDRRGVGDVLQWVQRRDADAITAALVGSPGESTMRDAVAAIAAAADAEASGIWGSAASALSVYSDPRAVSAAAEPDFDPGRFVAGSNTLLLWAEGEVAAQVAPVYAALLAEIVRARYEAAARSEPGELLLALDEVANISPVPWANLQSWLTEGRSRNVTTLAALQDLGQARHRWGETNADTLTRISRHLLVLPGGADETLARRLSAAGGQREVERRSESREVGVAATLAGGHRSESLATDREDVWPVHEILQGRPGHALHVVDSVPVEWVELVPWYSDKHLRHLQG